MNLRCTMTLLCIAIASVAVAPTGKPDYTALEKILATPPQGARLRIVVSHGNPLQAIAGGPELAEGEAAVIRGDGARWTIVARIRVEDWRELSTEP